MKKIKRYMRFIILIIIGSLLSINGFIYAKYISSNVWDFYLNSKNFYFSSDYLGKETIKNIDNQWNGDSVHFNIRNNLNKSVIATYNIEYEIECTIIGDAASYVACYLNGTDLGSQEDVLLTNEVCINNTQDQEDVSEFTKEDCEFGGYNWTNLVSEKDLYFDIVLLDEEYELTDLVVNIVVTSTAPYNKTLSGDFILHKNNIKEDNLVLSYHNYTNYDRLTISNSYSTDKCVKLTWDISKLILDTNTSELSSYNSSNGFINEIKFIINGKQNKSFIFYSKDFDIRYTNTEFTLEETSGC